MSGVKQTFEDIKLTYDGGFFGKILTMVTGETEKLWQTASNLIDGITPVFAMGFGIYVLLMTFQYYKQGFDEPIADISKRLIAWLLIIGFAFNYGNYTKLADFAYKLPDTMVAEVTKSSSISAIDSSVEDVKKNVDLIYNAAEKVQKEDRLFGWIPGFSLYIIGFFFISCIYLFFTAIFALYMVAKICLALVLMVGPIFIGCLLFPATRQWGMNWIGQITNYIISILCYSALATIMSEFMKNYLGKTLIDATTGETGGALFGVLVTGASIPFFLVSLVVFYTVANNIPQFITAMTAGASSNLGSVKAAATATGYGVEKSGRAAAIVGKAGYAAGKFTAKGVNSALNRIFPKTPEK